MSDDKNKRHPHDGKRIAVKDPKEVANWCRALNCTEAQLKSAVKEVGTSAAEVRKFLST